MRGWLLLVTVCLLAIGCEDSPTPVDESDLPSDRLPPDQGFVPDFAGLVDVSHAEDMSSDGEAAVDSSVEEVGHSDVIGDSSTADIGVADAAADLSPDAPPFDCRDFTDQMACETSSGCWWWAPSCGMDPPVMEICLPDGFVPTPIQCPNPDTCQGLSQADCALDSACAYKYPAGCPSSPSLALSEGCYRASSCDLGVWCDGDFSCRTFEEDPCYNQACAACSAEFSVCLPN